MHAWVYLSAAIILEVGATSLLKMSSNLSKPAPTIALILGYAASFYFLSKTMDVIPVSISYAIWSAAGLILLIAIDYCLYDVKFDKLSSIGLLLMLLGIVSVKLSTVQNG